MPFHPPTDPRYTDYVIYCRDATTDKGAEYITYFQVTVDPVSAPIEDVEAAVQRMVDLLASSPDFDGVEGRRIGEVTQTITPTEGEA